MSYEKRVKKNDKDQNSFNNFILYSFIICPIVIKMAKIQTELQSY